MDGRKLAGIAVTILIIIIVVTTKMGDRSDDSEAIQAEAMELLKEVDGYDRNAGLLESFAKLAHQRAFEQAYSMGSRRREASFDDEVYMRVFFNQLVKSAQRMDKIRLANALLAFCGDREIDLSTDP